MFKHRIVVLDEHSELKYQLNAFIHEKSSVQIDFYDSIAGCLQSTEKRPHVIFVEHKMSHIDGISAIQILRRRWRWSRIILKGVSQNGSKRINRRKYRIDKTLTTDSSVQEIIREIEYNRTVNRVKWVFPVLAGIGLFYALFF